MHFSKVTQLEMHVWHLCLPATKVKPLPIADTCAPLMPVLVLKKMLVRLKKWHRESQVLTLQTSYSDECMCKWMSEYNLDTRRMK